MQTTGIRAFPTHSIPGYQHPCLSSSEKGSPDPVIRSESQARVLRQLIPARPSAKSSPFVSVSYHIVIAAVGAVKSFFSAIVGDGA
jgi:hypothetical protein